MKLKNTEYSSSGNPTKEEQTNRGRRKITYVDVFLEDTKMQSVQELMTIMEDREDWSKRVKAISGRPDDDLGNDI